jgi:hypothetical protein
MNASQIFEQAIRNQEKAIRGMFKKWDDETQAEFEAKVARSIKQACGTFHAKEIPGINAICPGQEAIWENFRISRRRVDGLDNIYVFRI